MGELGDIHHNRAVLRVVFPQTTSTSGKQDAEIEPEMGIFECNT